LSGAQDPSDALVLLLAKSTFEMPDRSPNGSADDGTPDATRKCRGCNREPQRWEDGSQCRAGDDADNRTKTRDLRCFQRMLLHA
jgi:hypothetical protein